MCQELSDIMKRSWNSDGQQFHQYQQNEQSPLTLTHYTKKPLTYDIENTCSSLGQAQIVGINCLMGSLLITGYLCTVVSVSDGTTEIQLNVLILCKIDMIIISWS